MNTESDNFGDYEFNCNGEMFSKSKHFDISVIIDSNGYYRAGDICNPFGKSLSFGKS